MGPDKIIVIPSLVGNLSEKRLFFLTYSEPSSPGDPNRIRTYLLFVPSNVSSIQSLFQSQRYFVSTQQDESRFDDKSFTKNFANKLHAYSNLSVGDMETLFNRANLLTPTLKKSLE